MHANKLKKWSFRIGGAILILIMLAVIVLYVLINGAVEGMYGGKTEIADHTQFQVDARPTAITNVSILSPGGSEMLPNRTVLLSNGEIISITQDGDVPNGMYQIDGVDKFLIPGLTDSHMHLQRSPNDLLLYVANGVTQIRTMGGSEEDLVLKREIEHGRIGPHYYVSTPSMNSVSGILAVAGLPSFIPKSLRVWFIGTAYNTHITSNADQAEKDARAFIAEGHDGMKLYGFLDMESFNAILDAAEELDIPTAGHLPDDFPLSELRTTKLQEVGHVEEIVKALHREFGGFKGKSGDEFLALVNRRKDEIVADLVANDIAVQTTIWYTESLYDQIFDLETKIKEINLAYANPGIVEGLSSAGTGWLPGTNKFQTYGGKTAEEIAKSKDSWSAMEKAHHILLKAMVEGGVTILAGTDSNGWLTVPGFALHDELKSLNEAGMSPAQTLRSATFAPAKRIKNNAGVIEVGRRADLVLLHDNPLIDIENTRSIDTVFLNGRVLDRSRLDAMLEAVKAANASSRNFDLSVYE